jgi:hypothetical protein
VNRFAIVCAALGLAGCTGGAIGAFDVDGGPDAGGCSADAGPDGGVCTPNSVEGDPCADLVVQCCGDICLEAPGCKAAQLVAQYEPDGCSAALVDSQTFPRCEAGDCDTLVAKVCGDDDRCADAPGCSPAQELHGRATDPAATQDEIQDASAQCLQALEDDVVFSACP